MCPSCGTTSFHSARNGDKIVFHVDDGNDLITVPGHTFDETLLDIDPWKIYCGTCAWSGPVDDLKNAATV